MLPWIPVLYYLKNILVDVNILNKKSELLAWKLLIPGTNRPLLVYTHLMLLLKIPYQLPLLLFNFLLFGIVLWKSPKRASFVLLWNFKNNTIFFLYFLFALRKVCRNHKIDLSSITRLRRYPQFALYLDRLYFGSFLHTLSPMHTLKQIYVSNFLIIQVLHQFFSKPSHPLNRIAY